MGRVPRTSLPDGYFHVFARAVGRDGRLFVDDDDRRVFLALFWDTAPRHAWTCEAICLLSSHYHLVLESSRHDLSTGMQRLNWRYARYLNVRHAGIGHVFDGRFGARSIEGEEYLHDARAYVLLNPVRARLCDRIEDWPWSYSRSGLAAA